MAEPVVKDDFWGSDFSEDRDDHESAPVALLREQAEALTRRTEGRVEGVVLEEARNATAWASLYVKVPALQGYMHKIVTMSRPVVPDPAFPSRLMAGNLAADGDMERIDGMDQFRAWLKSVLSSEAVHAVIGKLLRYGPDRAAS